MFIDFIHKENETTQEFPLLIPKPVKTTEKKSSFWKTLNGKNLVSPETVMKNDHDTRSTGFKQYVFNPQFSTPTSLPLSFFVGYQILHEKKEWKQHGDVSLLIICFLFVCLFVFVLFCFFVCVLFAF